MLRQKVREQTESVGEPGAAPSERFETSSADDQLIRKSSIMMIDDEPTTLEMLQAHLEYAGYTNIVTTSDSSTAMIRILAEEPDVILLDINMPVVDGFGILAAMQEESRLKNIPVIVLTSDNSSSAKLKALQLGATDFLAKPVDPSELALRLRNTLAAKAYQDQLLYYDALTGLPNRRMFLERRESILERARANNTNGAILHIGLDGFKRINDSLGYSFGDLLLQKISEKLVSCLRDADVVTRSELEVTRASVSRVGGDEFTVLLPEVGDPQNASLVAQRVLAGLDQPVDLDGREITVTASIGIAVFPMDGDDYGTLLRNADVAMNHAKSSGRNNAQYFSSEMNVVSQERLLIEQNLRRALERDELKVFYQPKIDVKTGEVVGSEALIRWQHPRLGLIPPSRFIEIAEDSGLVVPIGEWILEAACKQTVAWRAAGLGQLNVSVNVSGRQFHSRGFLDMFRRVVTESKLPSGALTVELTENVLMDDIDSSVQIMREIRNLGAQLSIDDFGTGYSSLSYLQKFPVHELKVDQSFIREVSFDKPNSGSLARVVIAMARTLRLKVVAEGIETLAQLDFVRREGCDQYQGFLFSEPVPNGKFIDLLCNPPDINF